MANGMRKDWRELCIAVTNERDSTKFTSLVQELIKALDGASETGHTRRVPLMQAECIGKPFQSKLEEVFMPDAPRITVEELKMRMDSGEGFTMIDVRNPKAWAETDTVIPEAIRIPLDKLEENLPRIPKNRPVVAYCT